MFYQFPQPVEHCQGVFASFERTLAPFVLTTYIQPIGCFKVTVRTVFLGWVVPLSGRCTRSCKKGFKAIHVQAPQRRPLTEGKKQADKYS